MPFLVTQTVEPQGQALVGIYRTQVLADAAAVGDSTLTAVQGAVADADIPLDATFDGNWYVVDTVATDTEPSRKIVTNVDPNALSARAVAAQAFDQGINSFLEFVDEHAGGEPIAAVDKVKTYLYEKRRTLRMAFANDVQISGNWVVLTDPQFIVWATYSRFGPKDTSAVTFNADGTVTRNREGLVAIFERADDSAVLTPTGPITWVGLDVTQWTGGVPNRLNVDQITPVLGTAPSRYLDIHDDAWLRVEPRRTA